jgi:hypothetical protein
MGTFRREIAEGRHRDSGAMTLAGVPLGIPGLAGQLLSASSCNDLVYPMSDQFIIDALVLDLCSPVALGVSAKPKDLLGRRELQVFVDARFQEPRECAESGRHETDEPLGSLPAHLRRAPAV